MAIYYHEKQSFIYDSITKQYLSLETATTERAEYHQAANNEDVGSYHFFEGTITKIVEYKISLQILLTWKNVIKITAKEKEAILCDWKAKVCKTEFFSYSSACDDIGDIRARELRQ